MCTATAMCRSNTIKQQQSSTSAAAAATPTHTLHSIADQMNPQLALLVYITCNAASPSIMADNDMGYAYGAVSLVTQAMAGDMMHDAASVRVTNSA